ncbi:MAG: hypothetical protein Kow00121_56890 [Elainellaceae cyanobacterium]
MLGVAAKATNKPESAFGKRLQGLAEVVESLIAGSTSLLLIQQFAGYGTPNKMAIVAIVN